jgi:hypothetical protein
MKPISFYHSLWIGVMALAVGWLSHLSILTTFAEDTLPENAPPASIQQTIPPPPGPSDFGLVFINSAEEPSTPERIRRGIESGAKLDRFPVYWNLIERGYATFDWASQDIALRANEAHGLGTLAILLGTPGQYYPRSRAWHEAQAPRIGGSILRVAGDVSSQATCRPEDGPPAPTGLYNPIFVDGTDLPTPGKSVNPENPWARFVSLAVNRYRPGGEAGLHVRHWQIGNEPDLCHFWSGTPQEYARLLKVAYLVIKQSDPEATVLWGGLAHFANGQFLYDLVNALKVDPMAAEYGGFFDAAASHHYSLSRHSYDYTYKVRIALNNAGWPHKPIWITESGVPVCSDTPGPDCPSPWRATPTEQAAYIWQNVAYTRLAGGGPIFHFMLHDDCGNVVAVDSPDGFGLVKNEASSFCSPANAEPRLAYTAYQLAVEHFTGAEILWSDIQNNRTARRVAFYHPESQERRTLVWSLVEANTNVRLEATGTEARMVSLDGSEILLTPAEGVYALDLPGATNRNLPLGNDEHGLPTYGMGIYGVPYLLIERDTLPPVPHIDPLPTTSPLIFPVKWKVTDRGSGLQEASLWVAPDNGEWQLLKDGIAAEGTLTFTGEHGRTYRFAIQATDNAGNALTALIPLAETQAMDLVSVSGQVIDIRGQPVPWVVVKIGDVQAQTDAAGRFSMSILAGSWSIEVGGQMVHWGRTFTGSAQLLLLYSARPNAVENGDFEEGLSGWQSAGGSPVVVEQQPGTQDHALRLAASIGDPDQEGSEVRTSSVSQPLAVPAGQPYLAFAYKVESQEQESGHDRFEVLLAIEGKETERIYLRELSSDWRYRFIDLSHYAGEQAILTFTVYQSSTQRPTSALIDRVILSDTTPEGQLYLPLIYR